MKRTIRGTLLTLAALLGASCGGEPAATPDTTGTTRTLLDQNAVVGGPSTVIQGDSAMQALTSRATRVFLPELGYNFGDVAAPVKVIEFSDFGCGYCRRFHEETFPILHDAYVEPGRIEWKLVPFVTGMFPNSLAVAEAAECVLEQDAAAFVALGDRIWAGQGEWKPSNDPDAILRAWARELGVDVGRYDSCMSEDRRIPRVAGATVAAQQLGVRGTPTFWIVGYGPLQGALPLEVFHGIFDAVLETVEAAQDSAAAAGRPQGPTVPRS